MTKEVSGMINNDDRQIEEKSAEAKGIARKAKELAEDADNQLAGLDGEVKEVTTKVGMRQANSLASLKGMEEEELQTVEQQLDRDTGEIESQSNILNNDVTDSAGEASEAVTARVQEMDEEVRKA